MENIITVIRTSSSNPHFRDLIATLDRELFENYQDRQAIFDRHNIIGKIKTVVIAFDNESPVGCGCFKTYDKDTVEIKRMFVKQAYRGMGISKKILTELENWAKESGYITSILETGNLQTAAISLYQKMGYEQTENYGPYTAIPISLCFKKNL